MPIAKLRLGSHCSGWETLTLAARAIGIPDQCIDHKFASDIDANCREVIRQTSPSSPIIYEDVTRVDHRTTPKVHVFGAGIPCQPFSSEGLRLGVRDPRGRVGSSVIRYIEIQKPDSFLLENVPQFATGQNQKYFKNLLQRLQRIQDDVTGKAKYQIQHRVLDTAEHGIPQQRKRLYIVGVAEAQRTCQFRWPKKVPMPTADTLLDEPLTKLRKQPEWPSSTTRLTNLLNGLNKIKESGDDPWKDFGNFEHVIATRYHALII
jgi:DNA-cytosine methyltransferase